MTDVGNDAELYVLITYEKTVVAVTVVRHGDGFYGERTNVECFAMGDDQALLGAYLFAEKGVVHHAVVNCLGGVDGNVKFVGKVSYRLGVVCVVVRDEYALNVSE